MQIVKFLQDILPAIAQLAALTSTTIDDTICEFIRLAITNELVAKWLQDLLDQGLSAEGCAGLGAPSEVKDALSAPRHRLEQSGHQRAAQGAEADRVDPLKASSREVSHR
jgi:hypothetical protein